MNVTDALAKAELFRDLSAASLARVAALAHSKSLEEGDAVYTLGDDAEHLFVLTDGRVRFSLGVGNRPQGSGSIIEPISVFGWAALLEDQPRRLATATCLEDSSVLAISGVALLQAFESDQAAGFRVMRRLATMITRDFLYDMSV
jgi:CRP-like cAMP-binding protein